MALGKATVFGLLPAVSLGLSGCSGGVSEGRSLQSPTAEVPSPHLSPEDQVAEDLGVTLPPVDVVREISPEESAVVLQDCMAAAGWTVTLDDAGDVLLEYPPEQEESFNESYVRCKKQFPLAQRYTEPWGEAQYGLLYDHWINQTIPCLRSLGYSVETPPSRSQFIESAVRGRPQYFVNEAPYDAVAEDVKEDRWPSVDYVFDVECPVNPPDDVMYPDR